MHRQAQATILSSSRITYRWLLPSASSRSKDSFVNTILLDNSCIRTARSVKSEEEYVRSSGIVKMLNCKIAIVQLLSARLRASLYFSSSFTTIQSKASFEDSIPIVPSSIKDCNISLLAANSYRLCPRIP